MTVFFRSVAAGVLVLTGAVRLGVPSSAVAPQTPLPAAIYYVAPLSTDCTSVEGSGTLSDPWQNLFSALTNHTFNPGDVINLRGGTYRNSYSGFAAGCNMDGDANGVNTVLPLSVAGANGNPIVIQNYADETVIIDGSDADLIGATWTACGTGSWQLNNAMSVGSAKTGQVWINPSGPDDSGTRLAYDKTTSGCTGMSPGTFRFTSSGTGLFVRLPDSSDANLADLRMSCESGDCATYPINDSASARYVTVRKNPAGGGVRVKYGYYSVRVDNKAQHLSFDGLDILAAGGRDYGSCVRVYNGDFITFKNGSCREAAGEGIQLYGGGPGGSNGGGIQITNNTIENVWVSHTGFAWVDGGGIGNNLGFGVIIKNCSNCGLLYSTIRTAFGPCVEVTTSTDAGESAGVTVNGNDISDCGYVNASLGNRTLSCVAVEPQHSSPAGAVRNVTFTNNVCHNEMFGSGATWPSWFASRDPVFGLTMSDAGKTSMTGNRVINNSFDYFSGPALNTLEVSQPITLLNNAFGAHLATGGNVCNGNGGCDVMLSAAANVHSNNAYWAESESTQVIYINGGASFTRGAATEYEPSAVQSDPLFVSASNLRLQANSPMIDAGTNVGCPGTDALGVIRPRGPLCDVGAFESLGDVPIPSTPENLRIIKK